MLSGMTNKFTVPQESIAGLPTITFEFDGVHGRAELAGAILKAVTWLDGVDYADITIVDRHDEVLVDLTVRRVSTDENITVSVARVGSALLWSHARYVEATKAVTS